MKKSIRLLSLLFLLTLLVPPCQAEADRGGGGSGGRGGYSGGGRSSGSDGHGGYSRGGRSGGARGYDGSRRSGTRGEYRGSGRPSGQSRYSGHGGHRGFFPGLFVGGVLGWGLWSSYYDSPAYYYSSPPPPDYYYPSPPPPDYYYSPPPPSNYYPPPTEGSQAPLSASENSVGRMFVYPRQGQSEEQQNEDFDACHNWAVGQAGFDPSKPPAGRPDAQTTQKSSDYLRAISACLDGRGYTLK